MLMVTVTHFAVHHACILLLEVFVSIQEIIESHTAQMTDECHMRNTEIE